MAKGLFSVYQDDENVSITIKSKQQQQIKRKVLDSTSTSTSKNGKENSNSFGSDKSKGIIPGMKKKPLIHCGEKSTTSQTSTRSFLAPAPLSLTSKSVNSNTTTMKILPTIKGGNGICTGTLRTKEVNFPIYDSTSDITHINLPPLAVHSDVLILRESSSSTGMNSVNNSPSSAKDSGYASTSRSGNESNTSFGSGSGSESDMDLVEEDEVDKTIKFESEGDRRARALTESPLAEVSSIIFLLLRRCLVTPTSIRDNLLLFPCHKDNTSI